MKETALKVPSDVPVYCVKNLVQIIYGGREVRPEYLFEIIFTDDTILGENGTPIHKGILKTELVKDKTVYSLQYWQKTGETEALKTVMLDPTRKNVTLEGLYKDIILP